MTNCSRAVIAMAFGVALCCTPGCGSSGGRTSQDDAGGDGGPRLDGGQDLADVPVQTDAAPQTDALPQTDGALTDVPLQTDAAQPDVAEQTDATPQTDVPAQTDAFRPDAPAQIDAPSQVDAAPQTDAVHQTDAARDGSCFVQGQAIDVIRPAVTITRASGQATSTTTLPMRFAVSFSEAVDLATLTTADFDITPAEGVTTALVDSGDHATFELQITAVPARGAMYVVTLPAARVLDLAGNTNEPSAGTSNAVLYGVTAPTATIQATSAATVTNVLPFNFSLMFAQNMDPATITETDIINRGTATGVQWQLTTATAGLSYSVRAIAAGTPGTLMPVLPAGSVTTPNGTPNVESVYLGTPVMYTTLPILSVADVSAEEGATLAFRVRIQPSAPAGVLFDWTTVNDTAQAGTDYVAGSGTNVSIPTGGTQVTLSVAATPEDLVPEPHKTFRLNLTNVRGAVYVDRASAVGTIANDDKGYYSYSMNNGSSAGAGADWMIIEGSDVHVYGLAPSGAPQKYMYDLTNDAIRQSLSVASNQRPAGLAQNSSGYYLAYANDVGGYTLEKLDFTNDSAVGGFGTSGQVTRNDASLNYAPAAVAAENGAVYVVGARTGLDGDPAWSVEKLDDATGAPVATFGNAGALLVNHTAGTTPEQATRALSDGASLYLLGCVGTTWHVERRSAASGALVTTFASAGVLELPCLTRAEDIALHDGALYVFGEGAGATVLARHDAATGALAWARTSVMNTAGAVTAGASGVYIGGSRAGAWHVERWLLDGTPVWAQTWNRDKAPSCVRALVIGPGHWLHAAGNHSWNAKHDFYYERRAISDGLLHLANPGDTE